MKEITVIIPSYRCEKTISRTIDSILIQKGIDVEIIVVEDGVFDQTETLLSNYPDVKHIQLTENKGANHARNLGMQEATADFVMFIDADDYLEGDDFLLGLFVSITNSNSSVVLGRCKKLWEASGKKWDFTPPREERPLALIFRWLCGFSGPAPVSILWRKSEILRIGAWNESYAQNQDGELIIRAMFNGCSLAQSYKGTGVYVQHHGERVSGRVDEKAFTSLYNLDTYVRNYVEKSDFKDLKVALATYELQTAIRADKYANKTQKKVWKRLWQSNLKKMSLKDFLQLSNKYRIMHIICITLGVRTFNIFHSLARRGFR